MLSATTFTVAEAIEEWLLYRRNEGRKDKTLDNYRWCAGLLMAFLATEKPGEASLADLDRRTLMRFTGWHRERPIQTPYMRRRVGQPLSLSAQATVMHTIGCFLNWCDDQEELPIPNAFRRKGLIPKVPRKPREIPSIEEVTRLIATCDKGVNAYAKRGRAMLHLMLDTGLRIGDSDAR